MRKKLTLVLYLLFVDLMSYMLVVLPAYSFQVSSSTTGYVRIASQAATQAMISAQRSATLAAVAPLISGTSAGSVAVRMVAGSVGWPALGIVAGMTLAMLYYDSTKVAAIKAAAATPGAVTVPTYTGTLTGGGSCPGPAVCSAFTDPVQYVTAAHAPGAPGNCVQGFGGPIAWTVGQGWSQWQWNAGLGACVAFRVAGAPNAAVFGPSTPATTAQLQTYIGGLPSGDSTSVESNTVPVGAQAVPTPADSTASNAVPDTGLATSVVPATSVAPTDLVVNPNATQPTGTPTTQTTTQPTTGTNTTTTTTTTNPDGSVTTTSTETESETAVAACSSGNHEQRTFGSILSDHMALWQGSGLLSALNLLKTLTWPSTPPTYSLTSSTFGSYTIDFSPWSGMLTAIRSIIIALAGFVAYRIVFVGSK